MSNAAISYILPIRQTRVARTDDLAAYLARIARFAKVIVVDGSPADVFAEHARMWPASIVHVAVDSAERAKNGKVAGVRSAMRRVLTERVIIADDDVRYDAFTLRRIAAALDSAEIVRPQNYFEPMPWHAYHDTARTLLARCTGGDWPGTLALRKSAYERAGGYDGDVLFENLELVRTMRANGGRESAPLDLFVARRPPDTSHFFSQRVRQAYDEFARPARLIAQLALAPAFALVAHRYGVRGIAAIAAVAAIAAERGRRRAGGTTVFPFAASLWAPLWLAERAFTSWYALALRICRGGVLYGTERLRRAATPEGLLRARVRATRRPLDVATASS
ncbi:MAG: hypothetical protein NVSMB5_03530 [Candidatus Velthaea sp.]